MFYSVQEKDPDGCDSSKDMEKLKIMGILMFETALLDNGYLISDSAVYADHVFEVLTKMTGFGCVIIVFYLFIYFFNVLLVFLMLLFFRMILRLISRNTRRKNKGKRRKPKERNVRRLRKRRRN
jgi:ABC-type transport system involved in cytochrome bd biosynthesis fused ATPase/permease subunit